MTRPITFRKPFDDPEYLAKTKARFWSKVKEMPNGCWEWQGHRVRNQYGQIHIMDRGKQMAHRIAYELTYGSFPPQLYIRHVKCDNPPCCNPTHLAPGTHGKNMRDMTKKVRQLLGQKHPNAKLTEKEVVEAHKLASIGWSQTAIAKKLGVTPRNISLILSGKGWQHIK